MEEPMAEPHVVSALVAKRAELAGEIEDLERQADQLRADLLHIDAAIRIFAPEYRPNEIRPKAKRRKGEWFARGEMMRLVLETLRKNSDPVTAKEIALTLMDHKGFDTGDERTVRLVEKRVFSVLTRREGSLVEKVVYGPRSSGWKVR
jgi:hypothetical protein